MARLISIARQNGLRDRHNFRQTSHFRVHFNIIDNWNERVKKEILILNEFDTRGMNECDKSGGIAP
jgi:hypothetical protein